MKAKQPAICRAKGRTEKMLYPKNQSQQLSDALFRAPTAEYRATPFWAWNGDLQRDELLRQIEFFKKMGLGGFHMHVRSGMSTPYLSDEFMALIRACVDKAKQEEMLAWLYDEDRWPSGAAGGLVTKNKAYRTRRLLMTTHPFTAHSDGTISRPFDDSIGCDWDPNRPQIGTLSTDEAGSRVESIDGWPFACYDVVTDADGCLASARRIAPDADAEGTKWYAYEILPLPSAWYNNQTYLDTLNPDAVRKFIETTHDRYAAVVGDEFGKTVPAIFTDEPNHPALGTLRFPADRRDVTLPWTDDLPETFRAAYGEELADAIPELFWELPDGRVSTARYHFHDHVTERFTEAFSDQIGTWCDAHGIAMTGHVLNEPTLGSQTGAVGEAMRSYRGFELPGIDMLCSAKEYTTAKQAQSAAHQFGREGVMSELYGVTGWDFDFRGHKLNGDWQAALGVTVRVPHLSWYTMKGTAKRDYPASIHYQSTWGDQYGLVEDHFARVNTALTRGTPDVRVGVIHPIESYWLHWGPTEQTAAVRAQMDTNFKNITEWLLMGTIDFDFISESLLPQLCPAAGAPLQVGKMAYDVILVPGCETLRATTLDRLEAFRAAGGRVIFVGDLPTRADAVPSDRGQLLARQCECIPFAQPVLLDALESVRTVDLHDVATGNRTDNLIYQLRADGTDKWLFIAHAKDPYNPDVAARTNPYTGDPVGRAVQLRIRGEFHPTVYDTQTGETHPVAYVAEAGWTTLTAELYDYDSLLLRLTPGAGALAVGKRRAVPHHEIRLPEIADYTLDEPNVLLLDTAEVALDGGAFAPEEELLRAFQACAKTLHLDPDVRTVQPWVFGKEQLTHTATLRFHVYSEIPVTGAHFAMENAAVSTMTVNGAPVEMAIDGYFTDRGIDTVPVPELHAGENIIEVTTPIGSTVGLEWCYLLGDFGVRLNGRRRTIVPLPQQLGFDTVTMQNLPFYGADVTYRIPVHTNGGALTLTVPHYRGALVRVKLDGRDCGAIIYPPYRLALGDAAAGDHMLEVTLYGSRQNCFGPMHMADERQRWIGPQAWAYRGYEWTYEYRLHRMGLLSTPILEEAE